MTISAPDNTQHIAGLSRMRGFLLIAVLCQIVAKRGPFSYSFENYRHEMHRVPPLKTEYSIHTFNQTLDHFNALSMTGEASDSASTFTQRYLVTNSSWAGSPAPIFVFTGAEGGDVTKLYDYAYGHAVTVAKRHKALIIFLEHRFFGKSLPFGPNKSYTASADRIGLLTIEQSLADYATVLSHIRDEYHAWDSPLITFGGSLAGTLAAMMRIKYPNIGKGMKYQK